MDFFSCYNLSKSFANDQVLKKVNIKFPNHGIVTIFGSSGCGKSTLMNCLLGLEKADGKIVFQNKEIKDFATFRNKYTSVIFQNFHLFNYLSIKDNIRLFKNKKDYLRIIKLLNLENRLNDKVKILSGGEKQKVAIARSLMKKPRIIFCDEVTGSLDQENGYLIMDFLKEISKDTLVINITHNQDLIKKYSDYVIDLSDGEVNFIASNINNELIKEKSKKLSFLSLLVHSFNLMKKADLKMIIASISLVISLTLCGLIVNLNMSIKDYFLKYKSNSLDYLFIDLSVDETIKIENSSFSLVKQVRPVDLDEVKKIFPDCEIGVNYGNLINSYDQLTNNQEEVNITFLPTISTYFSSFNQLIVNEAASKMLSNNLLYYKNQKSIDYFTNNNQVISDQFSIEILFNVIGINNEMNLIQEPIAYFPYYLMEDFLDTFYLANISSYFNQSISLKERIQNYYYEGDFYNTGSIYLICHENKQVEQVLNRDLIKNTTTSYQLKSRSLDNFNTINLMVDKVVEAIDIFLFLSVMVSIALLGIVINSLIIDQEVELCVLKGLGVKEEQINKIISIQIITLIFKSILYSLLIRLTIYRILNYYFVSFDFTKIDNLLYENKLIIFGIILFTIIFTLFGKILVNNLKVSKVLKED